MKIKFSEDYKGPGLGFLTKARGYDKLAHFAVCLSAIRILVLFMVPVLWARVIIGAIAIGLEVWQGREAWREYQPNKNLYEVLDCSMSYPDGFSFIDLIADAMGIWVGGL